MYDEGIDQPVVLVTDYDNDGELDALSLVRDRQNSVKLIVNDFKEIVQEFSYSSYGETQIVNRGQVKQNTNNIFYYTSRELEPETGDYYYRARYYDPYSGRFLSEDPIGFKGKDLNLYRYVRNNPLRYSDPSGLFSSSGESERAKCRRETLERYYKEHQDGNLQCENTLESSMSYCDSIPEEPKTLEDLLGDPENEL